MFGYNNMVDLLNEMGNVSVAINAYESLPSKTANKEYENKMDWDKTLINMSNRKKNDAKGN